LQPAAEGKPVREGENRTIGRAPSRVAGVISGRVDDSFAPGKGLE